jgi:hypothetical protein
MALKYKGSIAIDPGAKLKITILFQKTAPFPGILFIVFATLFPDQRPIQQEMDQNCYGPRLLPTIPTLLFPGATKLIAGLLLLCFFSKKQR